MAKILSAFKRKPKPLEVLSIEEARVFFDKFGVDIEKLGLEFIPDRTSGEYGKDYRKWFENLTAVPVIRRGYTIEEDEVSVKITGRYVIQVKASYQDAQNIWRPGRKQPTPIDVKVEL